jgi:biotin carboxyl carrier protein
VNIDVTVDGRPWKVGVEPTDTPGQFAVTIEGTRRVVDASWVGAGTLSLVDGVAVRDVRIHVRDHGVVGIEIDGRVYDATVSMAAKRGGEGFSPSPGTQPAADRISVAIKAPMPGRVVRVLVAVGDRVTARQGVVVIEAMKMENELRTPRDGTIEEIKVAPGATVESGAVLVVIR